MLLYLLRRLVYAVPIALAVGFVCFMLVQIAPGDPINAIVPADEYTRFRYYTMTD